MEVADRLAIINQGRIEQVGTPDQLYDSPANEFVMTFLGPATRVHGQWVRPHDLILSTEAGHGGVPGTVVRVTHLGFEVRVELEVNGEALWAQVSRRTARQLDLQSGARVWVRLPSLAPVESLTAVGER